MRSDLFNVQLSPAEFDEICRVLYDRSGIKLGPGKEGLVKSRLIKRLRVLGLSSFAKYMKQVESDPSGQERTMMIDALTTNKTSFFREEQHFEYLRDEVLPGLLLKNRKIRIWSAGCSSGEEPYSLAILFREEIADLDGRDVRILATDLSTKVLERAKAGAYDRETLENLPPQILRKYFNPVQTKPDGLWRVSPQLRSLIRFAQLNLMAEWPMRGPFDAILCRNVMIYFDKTTQEALVNRFWQLLEPGGHLFVGHSESLTGVSHRFRYVRPATYAK